MSGAGLTTSSKISKNPQAHWHVCAFYFGMKSRPPICHGFQSLKEVQKVIFTLDSYCLTPILQMRQLKLGEVQWLIQSQPVAFFFSGRLMSLLRISMKTASTSSFSCCNQIREWESLKQERIKIASNARIRPDFTADPSCLSSAQAPAGCVS